MSEDPKGPGFVPGPPMSTGRRHEHDASCAFGNPTCPAFGEATEHGRAGRWWLRLTRACRRCRGAGTVTAPGERYTREELRTRPELASAYGDILANGGWAAPAVEKTCPRCGGTGLRKRRRK